MSNWKSFKKSKPKIWSRFMATDKHGYVTFVNDNTPAGYILDDGSKVRTDNIVGWKLEPKPYRGK